MRIPFATTLKSRDGTLDQDAKVVNGIVEPDGDAAPMVRRRPGLTDLGIVLAGAAQLLYYWYDKVRTVIGDTFYGGSILVYPTWGAKGSSVTLSNGNLTVAVATSSAHATRATFSKSSGLWYWEITIGAAKYSYIGVGNSSAVVNDAGSHGFVTDNNGVGLNFNGGIVKNEVSLTPDSGSAFAFVAGDVIGVALDMDTRTVGWNKNGGAFVSVTGSKVPTGDLSPMVGGTVNSGADSTANFGDSAFSYTPPTGYQSGFFVEAGEYVSSGSSALSPTSTGELFSAQDNGANSPTALLMIKNSTQAWTVSTADTVTQITDADYPGKYTVTLNTLTRSTTVATATTQTPTNFQVGSTVTIAGATNGTDWNASYTITGATPQTETAAIGPVEVTISRSSTTATATVKDGSAHGFVTGDSVTISGSDQAEYNGVKSVTVTGPTTFTFTVTVTADPGPATPATGSPVVSWVILGLTSYTNSAAGGGPYNGSDYGTFLCSGTPPDVLGNGETISLAGATGYITGTVANLGASSFEVTGTGKTSALSGTNQRIIRFPANVPTISSISRSGGVVTFTTSGAHDLNNGASVFINGCTQTQYNKQYDSVVVTSSTTFTAITTFSGGSGAESPATPATGVISATKPGSATAASFTFTVLNDNTKYTTPATGTITAQSGRTTVPGIAYLNGYFCVMDEQGVIYNSAIDDPSNWNALEYTSALNEPGAGVAIAKSGNYIAAFKEWSTEFFYDAKNETESPLSPVENGFTLIGCSQGWSVSNVDGSLMWIAQSKKHKGRQVYRMIGTEQAKVSTPDVERVLNADSLATVYAWGARIDGHPCYVLSLVASDLTLVYDTVSQAWYQWTSLTLGASKSISSITRSGTTATVTFGAAHGLSDGDPLTISGATQTDYNGLSQVKYVSTTAVTIEVENSPATPATGTILGYPYTESYLKWSHYAAADGVDVILHVSDGHLYEIDPDLAQDDGVPVNYFIRTARLDGGGTNLKKVGSLRVIGEKVAGTAMMRWSDDDSATFTKYRDVDLSAKQPELRRCGSFRRRSFELRHIENSMPRVSEIELGEK